MTFSELRNSKLLRNLGCNEQHIMDILMNLN